MIYVFLTISIKFGVGRIMGFRGSPWIFENEKNFESDDVCSKTTRKSEFAHTCVGSVLKECEITKTFCLWCRLAKKKE